MALAGKSICFSPSRTHHRFLCCNSLRSSSRVSVSTLPTMAPLSADLVGGISHVFTRLKKQGKVAFIPYITAGDPDLSTTAEALKVLDSCGADIIELGLPYSDPFIDGSVIKGANRRALANGANLNSIISMLKEVIPQISCPVGLFSYYNPIHKCGIEKFMSMVKGAGIHGLLVPDVPLEETGVLRKEAAKNKIDFVLLTTPTTPKHRMEAIVEASAGFVYLVSSNGVTGARTSVNPHVQSLLQEVKEATTKPVVVGFGISEREHVQQLSEWGADGVVIGSAMVKQLGEAMSPKEGLKKLEIFTRGWAADAKRDFIKVVSDNLDQKSIAANYRRLLEEYIDHFDFNDPDKFWPHKRGD